MSPFDPKPLPGGKPVAGPRAKKLALVIGITAAVVAMVAGPLASWLFPQAEPVATTGVVAEVVGANGSHIGPLVAGRRTLTFDDAGVRRTLTMQRPRGTAGPVVFDDAFYATLERAGPAVGRWIATDANRYRLIDVGAAAGNRPVSITVGKPTTLDAVVSEIRTGSPDYVPDPASFR